MPTRRPSPPRWEYWSRAGYYQDELRDRARGRLPQMESAKQVADRVARVFSPGDSILDVGCGTGHYLLSLDRRLRGPFTYRGVDLVRRHIADARKVFAGRTGVSFGTGDVRSLRVADRAFDITICANTVPHIPRAADALRELMRVTKKALLVRMLVGDEVVITKKAYADAMDRRGEPVEFGYVNIYTEAFVRRALGARAVDVQFLPDRFDARNLAAHHRRHGALAGKQRATRVVGGMQVKGYLLLPWRLVLVTRGSGRKRA